MAKSYQQKTQEDWERGQLKKFKRDNGLERKDVLMPQKERVRDYAGRSAGTAGGKGDRGNVSVSASGAGGKSKPSMNKIKTGKTSGNSASVPRRTGKAWVQDGRVMTWNDGDIPKSGGNSSDKTRNAITQAFNDVNEKNRKRR